MSLDVGDRVTISATHQVKIDRLDAWIKLEISGHVREGETGTEAIDRVSDQVASKIVAEIERQAGVIVAANAAQR